MTSRHKVWKKLWIVTVVALLSLYATPLVSASPVISTAQEAAQAVKSQEPVPPTDTPLDDEPQQFQISFSELGYGERQLISPFSGIKYTFQLPAGWQLTEDSYLDLDLSYSYTQAESAPAFFGELSVAVDGETQLIYSIKEPSLEHTNLRVPLPTELMNDPERSRHSIELTLDADLLCEMPHKANLVVHPTSFLGLTYNRFPLTIDLADFPRPFFQEAFEPDVVHFVLAEEPTAKEMAGALAIAARLGDLTGNQLTITGVTDVEWLKQLEAEEPLDGHAIIVGQPDTHRLLVTLNELGRLPVSFHGRQMELMSQGPDAIAPGDLLTFTLAVTNSSEQTASEFSLANRLPWQTQLVDCQPSCVVDPEATGLVRWSLNPLAPGRTTQVTLVLQATEVLTRSLLENTVTLLDEENEPINVDTFTTTLTTNPTQTSSRSAPREKSDYFFVYEGQAIAESSGIVQEIVSPWNSNAAILIATGLDAQAVHKASQALSFETEFPGMEGAVAQVSQVQAPTSASSEAIPDNRSFAALGYDDKTTYGASRQSINYSFFLPASWRLSSNAYVELLFRHSQLLDFESSSLTVLLNNNPLASIPLDKETASGIALRVKLLDSAALHGRNNRLSLRVSMSAEDICAGDSTDLWLTVSRDSFLHLEHQEREEQRLGLNQYPYPFESDPYLSDVLFALPPGPRPAEWAMALRLAADLGASAGGPALMPEVALEAPEAKEALNDYHVIALGQPSNNSWIRQVNSQLPQPFRPDSDQIQQLVDDVVFELPPDLSLGLVQLISSPWSEERAFLAVTGTTAQGTQWAIDAITNRPWALDGNLTLIRGDEIRTMDTRGTTSSFVATTVATAVPELQSTSTASVSPTPESPDPTPLPNTPSPTVEIPDLPTPKKTSRPKWLLPLIGLNGLAVVAILGVALWRSRRRR